MFLFHLYSNGVHVLQHIERGTLLKLQLSHFITTVLVNASPCPLFVVSPELCSERDYVITHSVRSMYVCMYVVCSLLCGILQNWSLYPHTLMYSHGTWTQWSLGRVTHVTSTIVGSKVILGSMTFGLSFWKKGHCIHILWCIFMGLGCNDPWVESHIWPQQTWGQRSSRGNFLELDWLISKPFVVTC